MTSKNKKLTVLFVVIGVCALLVAGVGTFAIKGGFDPDNTIVDGVTVGGVEVGGLTEDEAQAEVNNYIDRLKNRSVTIVVGDESVVATAGELGFLADAGDSVQEAYQIGKSGGFFSRFRQMSAADAGEKTFDIDYTVDDVLLDAYIEENCSVYNTKMKNSKLKFVDGEFQATKSQDGRQVQIEPTASAVKDALLDQVDEEAVTVEAVVDVTPAQYTKKQVSRCKDLLGTYSTSYSTSTAARKNNVQVAAGYIDGSIVYPGKTFSVVKTIKDRTEENGYQSAAEYSSGMVVEGIGGGVCQVSTTLYNAVLNAELEVVERSPHSMVVGYVAVSRDAAISGDYKDFKFKNNTDVPIYIAASADGSTLTFSIYGEETRPANREISFESEILETIDPGEDQITEDETLPAGYYEVTQEAHVGYKARLWKVVRVNGEETERTQINSSEYGAEPRYITVGKQEEEEEEEPEETEETEETKKKEKAKKKTKENTKENTKKKETTTEQKTQPDTEETETESEQDTE